MKKFLNALLIFALVFTMAVPAFAAVPSDVKGTDAEEAVAKLSALGVLSGYPDGTFRPDNNITRAEFAKIVAYAAGFASAAEYLGASNTQFSDVKADNWASGYIAVAANKGYLKGYPDGTFKPNNNVTYAEVVTVLLRVLGYNDNLIGSWPSNYIIQADDLDLLDDVKFSASKPATRGDVAVLTSGTLEQELVSYDKDTDDFDNTGKKLISKAFETSFKDAVVLEPKLVGDDEDQVSLLVDGVEKQYTAGDLDVSLAALWGHEVEFLLDDDENVVYINDVQSDDNVVTGDVASVTQSTYTVELDDEEEYTINTDAVVFLNDSEIDVETDLADLYGATKTSNVQFFLDDDGDVRFGIATKFDEVNLVITDLGELSSSDRATITTKGDATSVKVDEDTEFYVDGEEADYEDLAEDYIINVINDGTYAAKVYAYTDTVEGYVDAVSLAKDTVKVDGSTYDLVGVAKTEEGTLKADDETTYTFFFNGKGEVAYFEVLEGSAAEFVGFLAEIDDYTTIEDGRTGDDVRDLIILTEDGEVVTVRAASDTEAFVKGNVYKFVANDDGEYELGDATLYTFAAEEDVTDVGSNYIELDNGTPADTTDDVKHYFDAPVVFDASDYDSSDADVEDVEVVALADINDNDTVKLHKDGYYVDYIVITATANSSDEQLDDLAGVVVDKDEVKTSDGTTYYVTLNVDGEEVTEEVYEVAYNAVAELYLTALVDDNTNDDYGQYDDVSADLATNVTILNINTDDKTFEVGSDTFVADSHTVIYLVDLADETVDVGTFADINDTTLYTRADVVKGDQLQSGVYVLKAITLYGDYTD